MRATAGRGPIVAAFTAALAILGACVGETPPRPAALDSGTAADTRVSRRGSATAARTPRRAASALHVLTAPAPARNALEPLPEPLRVEVFDSRGRPVTGATVEWWVVRGGGRITASSTTDTSGIASAAWTPGPSADPQVVSVTVPGVGSVELRTSVAIASVAVRPEKVTVWPGDDAALRADLFDEAGHALTGGSPEWESSDSTTARVGREGVVTGVRAGSARVTASSGGASGATTVLVMPAIAGRLIAADRGLPPAAIVVARWNGRADTARVGVGEPFALRLRQQPDDTVDVMIVPEERRHHPARLRSAAPRELGDLRFVLLPTAWTIQGGTFAGRTVSISPSAAIARAADGSRFWRLERAPRRTTWAAVGWARERFPIPVAFRRGAGGGAAIGPSDSVAFWGLVGALERDLGVDLFTPATDAEGDELREAIHVAVDPSLDGPGYTLASWNGTGAIGDATVYLRSTALLGDATIATHELLHTLGVGHTSAWPSVMAPSGLGSRQITPGDVAYVQLLLRLRRVQEETDAPYGVVEAASLEQGGGLASPPPDRRDRGRIP